MTLSEELNWRGLVKDTTVDDLSVFDRDQKWTLYCGFDASAPSQTIGNLASLLAVKTFLRHGHKAILVAGGATSLIGDPGGKTAERQLQTPEAIAANVDTLKEQIDTVLAGYDYELVNNLDWLGEIKVLDWLRDIGKRFSVSQLIKRDYIAQRLGEDGSGISYTEFSYALLQAYDFWHLFKTRSCRLQIGGADQWGNCLAGVELIQKLEQERVEAITLPLVIDRATGKKFGKSEDGAIWLSPAMTSPYDFYQFWLNCDDGGLEQYLKSFTEFDREKIDGLMEQQSQDPSTRPGQKVLAESVTELVHKPDVASVVAKLSWLIFDSKNDVVNDDFVAMLAKKKIAAIWELDEATDMLTVIVDHLRLADSRREAKQFVADGSIGVIGQNLSIVVRLDSSDQNSPADSFFRAKGGQPLRDSRTGFWLIARGKNKIGVVQTGRPA